jgi:hypothetical protein
MNSSVSPTHGGQEMSVWSGHYECTCYHPLFVFNLFGDLERCALPGNVHSADGWESVLMPVVARYRGKLSRIYFRADARPARDVSTIHGGISTTFSLVKVLLWVQIRLLSGECRLKTLACRTLFVRQCDNACLDHASACAVESTWSSYLPAGNKISS